MDRSSMFGGEAITSQIKAIISTNLLLDGTEQPLAFDIASEMVDIDLLPGGIFEVKKSGFFSGRINLFIDQISKPYIILWLEHREVNTDPWELFSGAMVKFKASADTSSDYSLDTNLNAVKGHQLRVMIKKLSGTASLVTDVETVSLGDITQYPASINVFRSGRKK